MKKYIYWIKSIFLETIVFLISFLFVLIKNNNFQWKNSNYKKYKPILLIQGYLHNSIVWLYQGKKLKKSGYGPIYTINFTNPFSSVEDQAKQVEDKIKLIQKENNTTDLILIGHSMGGLIASYYALNYAKQRHITDIISIATPYSGSLFANIAIGKCAKEMKMHAHFIEDLKKQIENEKNINFYFICSNTDHIVRPKSALIGDNFDKQFIINDLGHATMLFSKKVNNQISKWLDS